MTEQNAARRGSTDLLFDARHIKQSGIGTYLRKTLGYLNDRAAGSGLTYSALVNSGDEDAVPAGTPVTHAEPEHAGMYSAAEQKAWHTALDRVRPRALWVPHYPFPFPTLLPSNRGVRLYMTIHDTTHLLPSDISGQNTIRRAYARLMITIDLHRATTVFAPSETTARALRGMSPSVPVAVAPLPVDPAWLEPSDPDVAPVTDRYFLYVGNTQRHKNLPLLLEAYGEIAHLVPQKLVIAGGGATVRSLDARIQPLVAALGERVEMIGRIDFDVLRALVAAADALVMPSLAEGVGLPPLEAMACRTAVLASDIDALKETCGDGAEFFDPRDPAALSRLLTHYGRDDDSRDALAERGWQHVTARQSRLNFESAVDTVCAELATHP